MTEKKCVFATCNNPLTDKSIKCSGLCGKFMHVGCSKINNNAFSLFATKNFKWFCDNCCEIIDKLSQNTLVMLNTLQSIAADIKCIIKPEVSGLSSERRMTRLEKKKILLSESDGTATPTTQKEGPLAVNIQEKIIIGDCADLDDTSGLRAVPMRKYVYASRLASSTTPEAIKNYLTKKLQISDDDLDCRLLVAANRDVSTFNFVSFKIGVSPDIFTRLLRPDVWPMGVMIREFIDRPKNVQLPMSLA